MELVVEDVKKSYGKKQVLKGLSLHAHPGECTGIIGANGSGKSTLLRILAGVEKAHGGKILIDGEAVKNPSEKLSSCVGYIPQESILMPELTVEDNLKLWTGFGDYKENRKILAGLCEQFKLADFYKEKVKNLSGGMNKRANIVCALIHQPSILLMDEPSAALDLVFKEELREYIRDFTKMGGSVLISSHDEGEIAACQSLWAIRDGKAVQVNTGLPMEKIISDYL